MPIILSQLSQTGSHTTTPLIVFEPSSSPERNSCQRNIKTTPLVLHSAVPATCALHEIVSARLTAVCRPRKFAQHKSKSLVLGIFFEVKTTLQIALGDILLLDYFSNQSNNVMMPNKNAIRFASLLRLLMVISVAVFIKRIIHARNKCESVRCLNGCCLDWSPLKWHWLVKSDWNCACIHVNTILYCS